MNDAEFDPYTPRVPGGKRKAQREALRTPEPPASEEAVGANVVAAGQLRSLIERIEKLEEEKKTIADDIKDVYAEAKGNGFDTKAIRTIVRLRKMDQAEREEAETILDLYKAALGMA